PELGNRHDAVGARVPVVGPVHVGCIERDAERRMLSAGKGHGRAAALTAGPARSTAASTGFAGCRVLAAHDDRHDERTESQHGCARLAMAMPRSRPSESSYLHSPRGHDGREPGWKCRTRSEI